MASYEEFKASKKGQAIEAILMDHDQQVRMIALAEAGIPPVQAVGKAILAAIGDLDHPERQHVGRWVRDILGPKGWKPTRKARVAEGNLFSRGAVYALIGEAS